MYADIPDSSGTSFVMGQGIFAYPPDESFDRISTMISTGPTKMDTCMKIVSSRVEPSSVEYIDVGDAIVLQNEDIYISLPREPKTYPRQQEKVGLLVMDMNCCPFWKNTHTNLILGAKNLKTSSVFYGWLSPDRKPVGAIPFPFTSTIQLPESLQDVKINDQKLDAFSTVFAVEEEGDLHLNWKTASVNSPLTISIKLWEEEKVLAIVLAMMIVEQE